MYAVLCGRGTVGVMNLFIALASTGIVLYVIY